MSLACSHRLPCPHSTNPFNPFSSNLPPYQKRAGPGNKSGLGLGSLSNDIVSGFFAPRGQTTTNASSFRSKFVRIPSWSVTIYLCLFVAVEGAEVEAVVAAVGEAEEAGEVEEEEAFSSEILGLLNLL